jgi:hypothetical protein
MANDRGLVDWEHQPAHNGTMEDIDLEKVKAYLAQRSANTRQASRFKDIKRVLIGMRCAVISSMEVVSSLCWTRRNAWDCLHYSFEK